MFASERCARSDLNMSSIDGMAVSKSIMPLYDGKHTVHATLCNGLDREETHAKDAVMGKMSDDYTARVKPMKVIRAGDGPHHSVHDVFEKGKEILVKNLA